MNIPKSPWRFDGHGINDADGNRITKVTCLEPVLRDGKSTRNKAFDYLSNLIAACPVMLETLQWIGEFSGAQKDKSPEEIMSLWASVQSRACKAIALARGGGK